MAMSLIFVIRLVVWVGVLNVFGTYIPPCFIPVWNWLLYFLPSLFPSFSGCLLFLLVVVIRQNFRGNGRIPGHTMWLDECLCVVYLLVRFVPSSELCVFAVFVVGFDVGVFSDGVDVSFVGTGGFGWWVSFVDLRWLLSSRVGCGVGWKVSLFFVPLFSCSCSCWCCSCCCCFVGYLDLVGICVISVFHCHRRNIQVTYRQQLFTYCESLASQLRLGFFSNCTLVYLYKAFFFCDKAYLFHS